MHSRLAVPLLLVSLSTVGLALTACGEESSPDAGKTTLTDGQNRVDNELFVFAYSDAPEDAAEGARTIAQRCSSGLAYGLEDRSGTSPRQRVQMSIETGTPRLGNYLIGFMECVANRIRDYAGSGAIAINQSEFYDAAVATGQTPRKPAYIKAFASPAKARAAFGPESPRVAISDRRQAEANLAEQRAAGQAATREETKPEEAPQPEQTDFGVVPKGKICDENPDLGDVRASGLSCATARKVVNGDGTSPGIASLVQTPGVELNVDIEGKPFECSFETVGVTYACRTGADGAYSYVTVGPEPDYEADPDYGQ